MQVRIGSKLLLFLTLVLFPALLPAASADADIREALEAQVAAWNRGDIPAFVSTYAADCTFVGKQILQGREQLLARYKRVYPSADAMGKLTFNGLNVRLLGKQTAVVTGEWHLERAWAGGGPVGGVFSLVWRLEGGHWLIVLDHTS
jgi:uncharacterized protein (TIGR02246 family)